MQTKERNETFLLNSARFQQALREILFLNISIPLNVFCCVLPRFRSNLLGNLLYVQQKTRTIELTKAIKRTKTRSFKNACFVSVSSRVSFVPPEVDARANLVHCPCVHLVKTAADVHMISGGTVYTTQVNSAFGAR